MVTTVTIKGQVSIPSQIRKQFNIEPKSHVEWLIDGNSIKLIILPQDPIANFRGKGKKNYTSNNLIQDRKTERKLENEKDRQ
jgi:AbrB family looped-hinge helix DNA binding protein